MDSKKIQHFRVDNDGKLPSLADGGYPLFYLDKEGSVLCPACANKNSGIDPPLMDYGINYESLLYCDECSQRIPSAYGDESQEWQLDGCDQ